ncbi:MAG: RidA family protein [Ferruginibacter sp.]|nr:RidA family protein [Cytophagales bacterium]
MFLLAFPGNAQEKSKTASRAGVRYLNPSSLSRSPNYSQLVEVRNGRLAYISGQVALDSLGNLVGKNDFRAQTEQVFKNLRSALEAVGTDFSDVVKINTYVVGTGQIAAFTEVRNAYFKEVPHRPASTWVQVAGLFRPDVLIEIEAIVILPE